MISIKHKFSKATLCEFDVGTVKEAAELGKANLYGAELGKANLYEANLRGADLYGADLRGADLRGADLDGVDLRGADLDGADLHGADLDGEKISKTPISIVGLNYWCLISDEFMRLGCQRHSHTEWANFSDEKIIAMDGETALSFWRQWKAPLMAMCAAHKEK